MHWGRQSSLRRKMLDWRHPVHFSFRCQMAWLKVMGWLSLDLVLVLGFLATLAFMAVWLVFMATAAFMAWLAFIAFMGTSMNKIKKHP